MKKNLKRVLISVAIIICAFSAIAFAAADGDEAVNYGALCLIPPLVTIVLAFVTKQTIISMFIGIWLRSDHNGRMEPYRRTYRKLYRLHNTIHRRQLECRYACYNGSHRRVYVYAQRLRRRRSFRPLGRESG